MKWFFIDHEYHKRTGSVSCFISAGFADRFGNGDPVVLAGKSGPEIAWDVFGATNYTDLRPKPRYNLNRSKEYWTG